MVGNALKKLLTKTVMKEFPEIDEILVVGDGNDWDENHIKKYKIFIGLTPENMEKVNTEDIRQRIRDYSLYILEPKMERLGSILVYNSNDWK